MHKRKNNILENFKSLLKELNLVDKAEDLAQHVHLGQKRRGGDPYIVHPKRVQLLAKELGYGKEIQISALLHDSVEDAKNKEAVKSYILSLFGQEVLNIIMLLTHEKNMDYNAYLFQLVQSSSKSASKAFQVKLLDMYDNLSDNPTEQQYTKYYNAIKFLIHQGIDKNLIPVQIYKLLKQKGLTEADAEKSEPKDSAPPEKDSSSDLPEPKSDEKSSPEPSAGEASNDTNSEPETNDGGTDETEPEPDAGGEDFGDMGGGGDMGGDMGDEPGDEEPTDGEEDTGEEITKYTDETNKIQGIKSQNNEPEPGFDFADDSEFYNDKYVGVSEKGSLIIGTPKIVDNQKKNLNFIKNSVLPKIDKIADSAESQGKKIILLGDTDYPYKNGKFKNDEHGIIAKYLMKKHKNLGFDFWGHKDYASFKGDSRTFEGLKSKTQAEDTEIDATLYLYNSLFNGRDKEAESGLTEKLNEWGFSDVGLNDSKSILNFLYPEMQSGIQTKSSFILKSYLHLMEVNLMKKLVNYESKNYVVIVPSDKDVAWKLSNSFKNIYKKSNKETNSNTNEKETK